MEIWEPLQEPPTDAERLDDEMMKLALVALRDHIESPRLVRVRAEGFSMMDFIDCRPIISPYGIERDDNMRILVEALAYELE